MGLRHLIIFVARCSLSARRLELLCCVSHFNIAAKSTNFLSCSSRATKRATALSAQLKLELKRIEKEPWRVPFAFSFTEPIRAEYRFHIQLYLVTLNEINVRLIWVMRKAALIFYHLKRPCGATIMFAKKRKCDRIHRSHS